MDYDDQRIDEIISRLGEGDPIAHAVIAMLGAMTRGGAFGLVSVVPDNDGGFSSNTVVVFGAFFQRDPIYLFRCVDIMLHDLHEAVFDGSRDSLRERAPDHPMFADLEDGE